MMQTEAPEIEEYLETLAREYQGQINKLNSQLEKKKEEIRRIQAEIAARNEKLRAISLLSERSNGFELQSPSDEKPTRGPGIRDDVLEALRNADGVVSPADILKQLEARGVEIGGKTEPATRIANELSKLTRMGIAIREGRGLYRLADDSEGGSNES